MGDFDDVERLQAGLRGWVARTARSGRHELRGISAPAVLPLLCAAAFGPALAGDGVAPSGAAGLGVLSSVGADVLALVLSEAADRVRSAQKPAEPEPARGRPQDLSRSLEREISHGVGEVLAGGGKHADGLRSDIAMVMREIDAGGTVLRAAIEAGDEELEREVLAAFEALGAEYGDLAFMLADLARAAGEVQDSLGGQRAELRAASKQVGRQSADVRMIREELAVLESRTRQWLPGPAEPAPRWSGGCPYRGLLPYGEAHEAVFFGRERLTAELAGRLAGTGMVIVTGASGAGKTSLLQAGLVPALARGVQVPGSSSWPVVSLSLTAAARPLTDLAAGLASLSGGYPGVIRGMLADAPGEAHLLIREILLQTGDVAQLVLIVDQFEQVFGPHGGLERAAFIDAVCAAARPAGLRGEPAARVVIAVRGDYWDQCAAYPELVRAMEDDQLVVGPMPEDGLRRVITGPAAAGGLRVDGDLVDAIVADVRAAGGSSLPLLSQALALTWENRDGSRLTSEGYARAGRVAGAVEAVAEAVYAGLPEDQQAIARDVFRRMTAVGQDRRPVRRPLSRDGHPKNEQARIDAVVTAFGRAGLLVLAADTAEIPHDVVLQEWPRLRDWLEEDQVSLILYGQLAEDTARWRQSEKDSSLLYRGIRLAAAQQAARVWAAEPGRYPALAGDEADFLRVSGLASARGRWVRRALAGFGVLVLAAGLAGAGLAVRSARNGAARQLTAEVSDRLAAQSTALEATDPVTAALLAGAAWRIAPTAQARYSLLEALAQPVRGILAAPSGVVTAVAYGPGGKTLAAGYRDGTVRLWDVASHRLISTATWSGAPLALAFADGGRTLEVASPAAVGLWNLANRATIAAGPLAGAVAGQSVAFSPSGGRLLVTGGSDGNVRLWDAATRQEIGAPMSSDLKPVEAVAFSPGGTTVAAASSDGMVQLWNVATQLEAGVTMATGPAAVGALAFSPGGEFLATGGDDGSLRLWDVATDTQVGATMATGSPVAALAFNASGTTIATAESNEGVELWSSATQEETGAAFGSGGVNAVAFSPGALTAGLAGLATGGGNVELWDPARFHQSSALVVTGVLGAAGGGQGATAGGLGAAADGLGAVAALSGGGSVVAVSDGLATVRLWDTLTRRPVGQPVTSHHTVTGVALSPDGKTLAVAAHGLQLWSAATGQRIGGPLPAAGAGGSLTFSPDGTLVAAIGADGKARMWDVASQREVGTPMTGGPGSISALAFSPDGKTLATVGANGTAVLWSVATGHGIGALMAAGASSGSLVAAGGTVVTAAAFSSGGSTLAAAGADGSIRLWDTATQREIGAPMTAGSAPVYALAFSPGGSTLAAAGADGSIRLWDTATQREIGAPMTAGSAPVYALAFSPDGSTLTAAAGDGSARRWDVAFPAGLLAAACAIADQSLTRAQWTDYAGTQPFQQVCPAS